MACVSMIGLALLALLEGLAIAWLIAENQLLRGRVENLERDYMQHLQEHHGVAWVEKYESD